jgi:hypothetical protein
MKDMNRQYTSDVHLHELHLPWSCHVLKHLYVGLSLNSVPGLYSVGTQLQETILVPCQVLNHLDQIVGSTAETPMNLVVLLGAVHRVYLIC